MLPALEGSMGPCSRPSVGVYSSAQRPFSTVRPKCAAEDLRSSSSMVSSLGIPGCKGEWEKKIEDGGPA